jgi:hypothetical protein
MIPCTNTPTCPEVRACSYLQFFRCGLFPNKNFCILLFFFRSFILVLFGVVTNGESIAAAANEANGSKITYVYTPLQISF